jgi:hypothetical protein
MAPSISEQVTAVSVVPGKTVAWAAQSTRPKTSGQHEPIYELLRPYEEFPTEITGPTAWKADDYKNNPERWTHWWSEEEISVIETAAKSFLEAGKDLVTITKVYPTRKIRPERC